MARLRANFQTGKLASGLTAASTTIAFASAPAFGTITAPDFYVLELDPNVLGTPPSGAEEIVYLTAYTAGQLTGTILRGQEGTTAASHSANANWAHAPTVQDFRGQELGYAQSTSAFSTASTTTVDIPGLSTTVTVGTLPIIIEGYVPNVDNSGAFGCGMYLVEDGTFIGFAFVGSATHPSSAPAVLKMRRAPAPGSHTYKLQAAVSGGTGTYQASVPGPNYAAMFIRVTEV